MRTAPPEQLVALAELVRMAPCVLPSPQTRSAEIATGDTLFNFTVFSPDPRWGEPGNWCRGLVLPERGTLHRRDAAGYDGANERKRAT